MGKMKEVFIEMREQQALNDTNNMLDADYQYQQYLQEQLQLAENQAIKEKK